MLVTYFPQQSRNAPKPRIVCLEALTVFCETDLTVFCETELMQHRSVLHGYDPHQRRNTKKMKPVPFKMMLSISFLLALLTFDAQAQNNFVYTNNGVTGANTVSAFAVAPDGSLTQTPGSPFATGGSGRGGFFASNRVAAFVMGNFLVVSNDASNDISVFSINPTSGALALVPGSPFATGGSAGLGMSLAVTPNNHFLFAGNAESSDISVFSVASNGVLTPVAGSPFPVIGGPAGLRITPDGKSLYAAIPDEDAVAIFRIGPNGMLTQSGPLVPATGVGDVTGVELNCAANLLFAAEATSPGTTVDVFSVASDGSLTPVPGSPFNNPGVGNNSNVALISRDNRFLYASNQFSNSVTVFEVASNGALSLVPGSPFVIPGGATPAGLATNASGTLLYVANSGNSTVGVFSIGSNGALSSVPGSPFSISPVTGNLFSLAAFPAKACPPVFDICTQDQISGSILKINSNTGDYEFTNCRRGITLRGKGAIIRVGGADSCTLVLFDTGSDGRHRDRLVSAVVNQCTHKAVAEILVFSTKQSFTIFDGDIRNNTCSCP